MDSAPRKQGGFALAEWRGGGTRRAQTCQPWRITRPPSRAALMQRRGSLSDRSRRQSCDCRGGGRNARRAYAQGIARLARYPPHDDRQHTSEHTARQGGSAGRLAPPLAARRDASPYRVPSVRFARVWLIGRRKRERLRRIKRHVPTADKRDGAPAMWPERIRRRGAADAAMRRRMATGGIPTEP